MYNLAIHEYHLPKCFVVVYCLAPGIDVLMNDQARGGQLRDAVAVHIGGRHGIGVLIDMNLPVFYSEFAPGHA